MTRKGSRRVLKHNAEGWKTISPSLPLSLSFRFRSHSWSCSSPAKPLGTKLPLQRMDKAVSLSPGTCLQSTAWTGWSGGQFSAGHPPQVTAQALYSPGVHAGRCLPSQAPHRGKLDFHGNSKQNHTGIYFI